MEAVEVYDKFPFSEELTYDDAYIFGEMIQILMKKQEFDDRWAISCFSVFLILLLLKFTWLSLFL